MEFHEVVRERGVAAWARTRTIRGCRSTMIYLRRGITSALQRVVSLRCTPRTFFFLSPPMLSRSNGPACALRRYRNTPLEWIPPLLYYVNCNVREDAAFGCSPPIGLPISVCAEFNFPIPVRFCTAPGPITISTLRGKRSICRAATMNTLAIRLAVDRYPRDDTPVVGLP